MKKIRVLFVAEDFYPNIIGGQGIYGLNLVKTLGKFDCQVTVLAEDRSGRKEFWGSKIVLVPFCFGQKLILAVLEYLYFWIFLRKEKFDILHLNGLSGLLFILFRPGNVGKIILMDHNTNIDMSHRTKFLFKKILYQLVIPIERLMFKKADGILFNNPKEESALKSFYPDSQKKTKYVYLGTERVEFSKAEKNKARDNLRKRLGFSQNSKVVLFVGRLVERKRVDFLIESFEYLRSAKLIIVGDGPQLNNLKFKILNLKLKNIRMIGWQEDLRQYYLGSDLFVTVSVAEGGFLLSGLEAAFYGLPLILSPSAAGFPIIKQGKNGYIIFPNNPKELALTIKKVLKNPFKMGQISRQIAKNFSWERCAKETSKFYLSVLGRF